MRAAQHFRVFHVFLVHPSKYDDEGFVIRHWRAVVPSNTLACLYGLTEDVRQRRALGELDLRIHVVDEAVNKTPMDQILRLNRRPGERVLVCLVGVQTNQWCRAADIALDLRKNRVAVMIGGFHVSGMLAMFPAISPEIQELVDAGVTVVAGEVEHRWVDLLRDAAEGKLRPVYRFLDDPPDLSYAPRPLKHKRFTAKYVHSNYGTMDCSRGCPFNCSFCTIINVQGHKSRYRIPECIADSIRQAYRESGVSLYFFTDDNFARNPAWEEIFNRLIVLREDEGIAIEFVIQADIPSHRIPGFIEKAVRAGCCTVFIGLESLNPRNLQAAGKTQNRVQEYREAIAAWRDAGVATIVGYIIGFPHDTEQSIKCDVRRLIAEVQPDQASFFMLTPLPGSRDHREMIERGAPLEADYNRFDCMHETMSHPGMKDGSWTRAYAEAWRTFYSLENMKTILLRTRPEKYWDVFCNLFWYRNSVMNDGIHPMLGGLVRLKDRANRRACFPLESRLPHLRRRIAEIFDLMRRMLWLLLEMEELWLATRLTSAGVSSRISMVSEQPSLFRVSRFRTTRRDLMKFWIALRRHFRRGEVWMALRVDRILWNAAREIHLAAGFLAAMVKGGKQRA